MTPGEGERAQAELRLAGQALRIARLALQADAREDAASRLYYAAFHAARAALTVQGRYARTHSGQITVFEAVFGPAPLLGRLFGMRLYADYSKGTFTRVAEELAHDADEVGAFVERCRAIVGEAAAGGPDQPDTPADL